MNIQKLIYDAKSAYLNSDYDFAISKFEEIVQQVPNCEECYFYLGLCYEKIGYEIKAIEYYKKGLVLCDNEKYISDYYLNIGKNLLMISQLNEALFSFDKASMYQENYLVSLYNKSLVYMCQKNYKQALETLNYVVDNGLVNKRIKQNLEYCANRQNTLGTGQFLLHNAKNDFGVPK